MDFFEDGKSPYEVLGLDPNPELTDAEIKKAYRALSLVLHPDKNRDNPNAAKQFQSLVKAYKTLTDASARGALDDYLKAKRLQEERDRAKGEGRRKLREELERRERQSANERSQEEIAKAHLKDELDRIRMKMEQEAAQRRNQAMAKATAAAYAAAAATPTPDSNFPFPSDKYSDRSTLIPDEDFNAAYSAYVPTPDPCLPSRKRPVAQTPNDASGKRHNVGEISTSESSDDLRRSLKVSWDPTIRDYSSSELRTIFGRFGAVEGVVLKDQKKPRKALALVMMAEAAAADVAAASVCGELDAPLLVLPLLKIPTDRNISGTGTADAEPRMAEKAAAPRSVPQTPGHTPPPKPLFPSSGAGISKPLFPSTAQPSRAGGLFPSTPVGGYPKASPGTPFPSLFPTFPSASSFSTPSGASNDFPSGGKGGVGRTKTFEEDLLERMQRASAAKKAAESKVAETEANGSKNN